MHASLRAPQIQVYTGLRMWQRRGFSSNQRRNAAECMVMVLLCGVCQASLLVNRFPCRSDALTYSCKHHELYLNCSTKYMQ